ncbi:hypothetical protein ACFL3C_03130 [Patescibacteria group bacterium]
MKTLNPKRKIIIALSAIIAVVAVLVVASTLVDPPFFKGFLSPQVSTVSKTVEPVKIEPAKIEETTIKVEEDLITSKLAPELKEELIMLEPVEKSEEAEEPLELVLEMKPLTVATPPVVQMAYRNRIDPLDPMSPDIYKNVSPDTSQVVLILRFRNTGSMPAYLKSFGTVEYGCDGDSPCRLATTDGRLVRVNYDSSGYYVNAQPIGYLGYDPYTYGSTGNGFFEEDASMNHSLLEITGNADTYFAVYGDTSDYLNFGNYDEVYAQAFVELSNITILDGKDVDLSMSISPDTVTPETMVYSK